MLIWHNPLCSKSRAALALLQERGHDPEVYLYLEDPPDESRLDAVLRKLNLSAASIVRRGQDEWRSSDLTTESPEADIRAAMLTHPVLIERPIVETAARAVIGRPPEAVLELI